MGTLSQTSGNFNLDTLAPQAIANLSVAIGGPSSIDCTWVAATDTNFDHYEIWWGPDQNDVQNRTGTATEWDDGDDGNLGNIATTSTTVVGVTPGVEQYFSIFAIDIFQQTTRVDASGTIRIVSVGESADFDLDTLAPQGLSSLAVVAASSSSVDCTFDATTDANFNHYEIWYGTNQGEVQGRTGGAVEWDDTDDGNLAVITTTTTTITSGLTPGNAYYFSIWAVDNFGNESTRIDTVGSVQIFYEGSDEFDGDFHVGHEGFPQFDGTLLVYTNITVSFDGVFEVEAIVRFSGQVDVAHDAFTQFDGKVILFATVAAEFMGRLKIDFQVMFAGRFDLRDPYSPYLDSADPAPNSLLVPVDSTVTLVLADDESGVDLSKVRLTLTVGKQEHLIFDGQNPLAYPAVQVNENLISSTSSLTVGAQTFSAQPAAQTSAGLSSYTFIFTANVLDGAVNFPYNEQMFITIRGEDFGGNEFGTTYRLTTARNPIPSKSQGRIIWEENEHFMYNLEYGLNVPQRVNLVVENDHLCLAD